MPSSKGKGCHRWSTGKHQEWQSVWGGVGKDRHRERGRHCWPARFAGVGIYPHLPVGEVADRQTNTMLGGKLLGWNHFLSVASSFYFYFTWSLRTELSCPVWHRCDLPTLNFCCPSGACVTEPSGSHLILLLTFNRERSYSSVARGVVELSLSLVYLVLSCLYLLD